MYTCIYQTDDKPAIHMIKQHVSLIKKVKQAKVPRPIFGHLYVRVITNKHK